ncbi:MAG: hypothetical protein K5898_09165 [Ruminococcus sp.]|uniref:hypothetical protein n=1 Tax=Ruminococcus sp. TaxID=41978 RepID=UPI0025F6283B|nr:hypothetical protein [Ruminococcus sp.]MCR4795321.1 hypothetical protein [Ruminococcus sp.]
MEPTTTTNIITTCLSGVADVVSGAIDIAVANPIPAVFLGMGLVGAGYGLFTKIRNQSN